MHAGRVCFGEGAFDAERARRCAPRGVAVTVTVLLFASYADVLGKASVNVQLPAGATVADLLSRVAGLPGASRLPPQPLVAVNRRYAPPSHALAAGDEVALIPPVAGG